MLVARAIGLKEILFGKEVGAVHFCECDVLFSFSQGKNYTCVVMTILSYFIRSKKKHRDTTAQYYCYNGGLVFIFVRYLTQLI